MLDPPPPYVRTCPFSLDPPPSSLRTSFMDDPVQIANVTAKLTARAISIMMLKSVIIVILIGIIYANFSNIKGIAYRFQYLCYIFGLLYKQQT